MFRSLASYLFGSNTNCETNSETNSETNALKVEVKTEVNLVDADNLIEVTSLTPSVAGTVSGRANKRGKNRQNNFQQQNKRKGGGGGGASGTKAVPSLRSTQDEEINEDEWFIVEKEEEETNDSPNRCDNEGKSVPVIEVVKAAKPLAAVAANTLAQQRCQQQHIKSDSIYSGPRPQRQRNFSQKIRKNNNRNSNGLSVSSLSPSRTVNENRSASGHNGEATADNAMTRSLYVVAATKPDEDEMLAVATTTNGIIEASNKMEESWFVTPPPCFTSIGPINMETSPFENLLIEHPSMSVYHSIKTVNESFIKLDLGKNDMKDKQKENETTPEKNKIVVQTRRTTAAYLMDRQAVVELKQEQMARNAQKIQTKKELKDMCLAAMKRANKAYDIQYNNQKPRRCDNQHYRVFSNVNNNRKSNSDTEYRFNKNNRKTSQPLTRQHLKREKRNKTDVFMQRREKMVHLL